MAEPAPLTFPSTLTVDPIDPRLLDQVRRLGDLYGPRNLSRAVNATQDETRLGGADGIITADRTSVYSVTVAGRQVKWRTVITVWHCEPGGRDALTVCRRRVPLDRARWWYRFAPWWSSVPSTRTVSTADGLEERITGTWGYYSTGWNWHIHHWQAQIHMRQTWLRWRHSRCAHCDRRFTWGYAPVSQSWDDDGPSGNGERNVFHHECSTILHQRQTIDRQKKAVRWLFDGLRVAHDLSEQEMLARLYTIQSCEFTHQFWLRRDIETALGWERDRGDGWPTDDYQLVHKERCERFDPYELAKTKGWRA
jgi:hypothetical protein